MEEIELGIGALFFLSLTVAVLLKFIIEVRLRNRR